MFHRITLTGLVVFLLSAQAAAQMEFPETPYQASAGVFYNMSTSDTLDLTMYGLQFAGNFPEVVEGAEPVEEAEFVQRAADLEFQFGLLEFEIKDDTGGGLDLALDGDLVAGHVTLANKEFPVALIISGTRFTIDDDEDLTLNIPPPTTINVEFESETTEFGGLLFVFASPRAGFGIQFSRSETDSDITFTVPAFPAANSASTNTSETARIGAMFKVLLPLPPNFWLNVEGGGRMIGVEDTSPAPEVQDEDMDNHEFYINSDFYVDRYLSVGLGVSVNNGDDKDDKGATYGARIRYNFGTRVRLELSYSHFAVAEKDLDPTQAGNEADDRDDFNISVIARF
jgi:hypothetical protein